MSENFKQKLEGLLKKYSQAKAIDLALKNDKELLGLLLAEPALKERFFEKVANVFVFKQAEFCDYLSDKNFLANSYTKYKNKIGLNIDNKFLNERGEVALVWPFKDCVLEGGATRDEENRKERFFNTILAQDEIDQLFSPKVLTAATRFAPLKERTESLLLKRDADGVLRENLIIKGNNLLALHSLKQQFQGRIKLIYIDPPFNPESKSNTFCYNNNFNHSTWLTFMKNRLEVAKDLLTKDGVLICAIDDNEFVYLGVLLNEVFSDYEIHCITIVHNPRGIQGTNFSYTHEYAFFVLPKGVKSIGNRKVDKSDIQWRNLRDNGGESLRTDAKNCFYPVIIENNEVVGFGDVVEPGKHPAKQAVKKGNQFYIYPIDKEGIERKWRYARQSVEQIKHLLRAKKTENGYEIEIGKDFGSYRTVWVDKRYDANEYGTKLVKELVPNCPFDFPKSFYNVYDCLYSVVADDKEAIVLDFFAGSGTTAQAVLELNKEDNGNRKFILVEQMDYVEKITVERVKKVLQKENINDSFIYMELMKYNEKFVGQIQRAKTTTELLKIWQDMQAKSFLNFDTPVEKINQTLADFKKLPLKEQKQFLFDLLNKNQLYVPLSSIADTDFKVSISDKNLNKDFYGTH